MLACDEDGTVYSVDPELAPYVNLFYLEGVPRRVTLPKNNLIATLNSDVASITVIERDGDQWYLEFDKETFNHFVTTGDPYDKIESFLFHELGRILLHHEVIKTQLPNDPEPFSIMNPYYKWNGYSLIQRSILIDELFGAL